MGKLNIHFDEIQAPAAIAIADKVRALKAQGVQIAAMQTGEPCFATPDYIKHAAIEALAQNQTKYCESLGLPVLRNALSNYYSEHFNHSFSASQFFISPGASYSIYSILNAILNVGDEVIIPDPSWPQYHNISVLCGANPIHVSTRTTGFKITVEALERLVSSNTKVLILNNPNNPTGVVYSKEELEWIIEFAASKSMYVLVDEVYDHIVYSSNFNKSFSLNLTEKQRESILYVNSFSKTFAMTGWRIAYSYLPEKVYKNVAKLHQNSITNVAPFIQYAAATAITQKKENRTSLEAMFSTYQERFLEVSSTLLSKGFAFAPAEGAFYLFIKKKNNNPYFALDLLEKHNIAVVPGEVYGADFSEYFRISFAVDELSYTSFLHWIKNTA